MYVSKEELIRLDSLCCECESMFCAFVGEDGICKAPFVTNHEPRITDDGCTDAVIRGIG